MSDFETNAPLLDMLLRPLTSSIRLSAWPPWFTAPCHCALATAHAHPSSMSADASVHRAPRSCRGPDSCHQQQNSLQTPPGEHCSSFCSYIRIFPAVSVGLLARSVATICAGHSIPCSRFMRSRFSCLAAMSSLASTFIFSGWWYRTTR